MLISAIAIVFVFGLLVLVHEFGHFITAKKTGMRVDEFAIGFGPKLVSTKRGETVYSIRAIPLGGFNKIAGMEKGMDEDAGMTNQGRNEKKTRHVCSCRLSVVQLRFARDAAIPNRLFRLGY